jgi:hypothetical protein
MDRAQPQGPNSFELFDIIKCILLKRAISPGFAPAWTGMEWFLLPKFSTMEKIEVSWP